MISYYYAFRTTRQQGRCKGVANTGQGCAAEHYVLQSTYICVMSLTLLRAYQCPYPPFPFPTYYPDTGTGSGHSNRIYVEPFGQPLSKQTSRRLTTLHAC